MSPAIPPTLPAAPAVRCEKCGHAIPLARLSPTMRAVEGRTGCYDVGFICPACRNFYHAAYTNDTLMSMQRRIEKIRKREGRVRLLQKYKTKFERFQIEMDIALKPELT